MEAGREPGAPGPALEEEDGLGTGPSLAIASPAAAGAGKELVSLRPGKAAELVATHFSKQIETVLKKLQVNFAEYIGKKYVVERQLLKIEDVLVSQELLQTSPCVAEQFTELLCPLGPSRVTEMLPGLECCHLEESIQVRPMV
ncbi:Vacuolar protein sorting-associated protein 8-like protein [Camelus dromedarius]|uniref:Vacuolar protein sorting-associated protein 8-like protein n=1 Tax=Camelus dromedarius TaxID=9838 RepID=A0A5N4DLF0_CAMDR|nr:Vacuolar protein sorting-associated protein 8-like protein [Camelus dromedarius]